MSMTRREILQTLPALSTVLLPALAIAEGASAQTDSLPSKAWAFDELKVDKSPNGDEFRAVLKGKLATGELLEVHETMLPPGAMPLRKFTVPVSLAPNTTWVKKASSPP